MSKRRERRERAKEKYTEENSASLQGATVQPKSSTPSGSLTGASASSSSFVNYYTRTYRKWLILPIIMLVLALIQIGYQTATTGSFLHKGVELKGGLTITLTDIDMTHDAALAFENTLKQTFSTYDVVVNLQKTGVAILTIKADIVDEAMISQFKAAVSQALNLPPKTVDQNLEITGSTIGDNFFRQTLIALIIAFIFMALSVILYLRYFAPALAVILAAFSDMVVTLAVVNLLGIKLSTAGIVAFLFLIGYSVDTDMLLSARVLRRKEGTYMERALGAMKTGMTMTTATLAAVIVSLIFTHSEVISQIMVILLIGLLVDIINTWIQNVAILVWYLERRDEKKRQSAS